MSQEAEQTALIANAAGAGDDSAAARLMPRVYDELRNLASGLMRRERAGHTLQPTALVNEAFLKLVSQSKVDWNGTAHFRAVAAQAMSRILIDHARAAGRAKRAGDRLRVTLDDGAVPVSADSAAIDAFELADVLEKLKGVDELAFRIIELRFFGGLSEAEIAVVLGWSERKLRKEWAFARTWLIAELQRGGDP